MGLATLGLVIAGSGVRGRINGQVGFGGDNRVVVVDFTLGVQWVPKWDGHTEEALATDEASHRLVRRSSWCNEFACRRDATGFRHREQ